MSLSPIIAVKADFGCGGTRAREQFLERCLFHLLQTADLSAGGLAAVSIADLQKYDIDFPSSDKERDSIAEP